MPYCNQNNLSQKICKRSVAVTSNSRSIMATVTTELPVTVIITITSRRSS